MLRILVQVKQHDANDPFQCLVLSPIYSRKQRELDTSNVFRSHNRGAFIGISVLLATVNEGYLYQFSNNGTVILGFWCRWKGSLVFFRTFFASNKKISIFSQFIFFNSCSIFIGRKMDFKRKWYAKQRFDCNVLVYIAHHKCLCNWLCDPCADWPRHRNVYALHRPQAIQQHLRVHAGWGFVQCRGMASFFEPKWIALK